jgi:hypothetical protein
MTVYIHSEDYGQGWRSQLPNLLVPNRYKSALNVRLSMIEF